MITSVVAFIAFLIAVSAFRYMWEAERALHAAHTQLEQRIAWLEYNRIPDHWDIQPPRNSVDL